MNTRRNSVSRKNRRGVFGYVYRPVGHLIQAADSSVHAVANTARNVVSRSLRGVNRIGKSVTGHANAAVSGLLRFKGRKATRKASRKASRKQRKSRRANRKH
jgi:hypothetical protein